MWNFVARRDIILNGTASRETVPLEAACSPKGGWRVEPANP